MTVTQPLQKLLDLLPLHAEEGRLRESVAEDNIICQINDPAAATVVAMARRIFESLALLDQQSLKEGNWAFVSFPASLLARSLIATWGVPDQRLVESGYWESDSDNPEIAEEQRKLLHILETRRQRFHPEKAAIPIRYVHVAWGIVRLGGRYLMRRREDRDRSDAKRFVFPGGRLRPSDFPEAERGAASLRLLADIDSPLAERSLPNTLTRELDEELGLVADKDYKAHPWKVLKPYCEVEGGGNKHALTRYRITLHTVALTESGETRLLERIVSDPDRYPWFSIEELASGKRPDGATVYLDALHADMGEEFSQLLDELPDSSGTKYLFADENSAIELPASPDSPFHYGKTGREKEVTVPLNAWEWDLLMLLGWCGRGFSVRPDSARVMLLGGGWIKLLQTADVAQAKHLANRLSQAEMALIQFAGEGLRLAVQPEHTYFAPAQFAYTYRPSAQRENGNVELTLRKVETAFGLLDSCPLIFSVPPFIASVIEAIEVGRDPNSVKQIREAGDPSKQNRDTVTRQVRDLGLRRLIRIPGSEREKDLRYLMTVPRSA